MRAKALTTNVLKLVWFAYFVLQNNSVQNLQLFSAQYTE